MKCIQYKHDIMKDVKKKKKGIESIEKINGHKCKYIHVLSIR